MALVDLILVLTGSLLHLGWNVQAKKARDKFAFVFLALLPGAFVGIGLLTWSGMRGDIDSTTLAVSILSGAIHTFYMWALTQAYHFGDISFVYPYCRGIGALIATIAGIFLLKEDLSPLGATGIGLTILATLVEPLISRKDSNLDRKAVLFTLATGLAIAAYLVVDKIGVTRLNPIVYLGGITFFHCLITAPIVLRGRRAQREWQISKKSVLVATLFMFSAYSVVLIAMTTSPVGYVVAARASGIVFSGIVGWWILNETVSRVRWLSIALITAGVFLIGIA